MKKMIYLMTAVIVALAFNACSTNDNPSTPGNPSGRAVITVNTAAMYEEVDLVPLIEQRLTSTLCITDTVLIYDQNGHLVKKLGMMTKSLEPLTFVVDDLPNGTYTLVAWQTGIYENEKDRVFVLADEEELATVKMVRLIMTLLYGDANGFAYQTVTVNGNSFEATVTPKLIGRFVNLKSEKALQEYGLDKIYLYCDNQVCHGLYLDPSRSGDDRWIIGQQEEGAFKPFAILEKNETEYMHYMLEQGDDVQLHLTSWTLVGDNWEGNRIVNPSHHKLQDGGRFVYYFDIDRLTYQPPFFGPEDQLPAWKADRDAGILVNDTYIKWGANLAEVKAHRQAKQFWAEGTEQPQPWEGVWHYAYFVANNLTEQYIFETADGQNLEFAYSVYYGVDLSADVFTKSLQLQGYTYLGKLHYPDTEDYYDLFQSADKQTGVGSYSDTESWILVYYPFDPEELNYIVPGSLAPATSKVRSIVPDVRRSSLHGALKRDDFIKPSRMTTSVDAFDSRR